MPNAAYALLLVFLSALSLSANVRQQIAAGGPELAASTGDTGIFTGSSDVGTTLKGSTSFDSAKGEYHVTGGGADMWGASDAFHFTWIKVDGDTTLESTVIFPPGVKEPLEKAVLVFRQSLAPGSAYADVAMHGDGHITLQYRRADAAKTEDTTSTIHGKAGVPTRLRIERHGNVFTVAAGSVNGPLTASAPVTIPLTGPVYAGIGVCAHGSDKLANVTFSHVAITHTR